jgi:Leucine-rich repeat (LRR) protein
LSGNSVQFNFAKIPEGTKLEFLVLSATDMKSMTGISRATSLRAFHATKNQIRNIPEEVFSLSNLESLFLSYNIITGRISRNFGKMSSLKELYLFGNHLTGTVPGELSELSNLTELVLASNFLSGSLPAGLSSLPNLEQFSIYGQQGPEQITGPVPSFSGAKKLA